MPILVLTHGEEAGPERVGVTLRDHGFVVETRRADHASGGPAWDRHGLPRDLDDIEGVLIQGGDQCVLDLGKYDWMQREVELVREAHARQLPVLGTCLGIQLIAVALGGEVGDRERPAVGMLPMRLTAAGQTDVLFAGVPWSFPGLFSCNQEVTKLPPGAVLLAGTPEFPVQVFRAGLRTYGFAPHFEHGKDTMTATLEESGEEAEKAGRGVDEVAAEARREYARYARVAERVSVNIASYLFPAARKFSA